MPRTSRRTTRKGPVASVPCPWCGKKNDLAALPEEIGQTTYKKSAFRIDCDHCRRGYVIQNVQLIVTVARYKETKEEETNG